MAKIQTVGTIGEFMSGEWKRIDPKDEYMVIGKILAGATTILVVTASKTVFAADGNEFLYNDVMSLFDKGVVLVIVFAGACWSLGNRGKALEILIGVCCGYILARKAVNIRDYLKGV